MDAPSTEGGGGGRRERGLERTGDTVESFSGERIKARARSISAPSNERVIYSGVRKDDGARKEGRVE